jgi:antirestriction protein ArdC
MKSEEIKQLTDKALNELLASLESGHSETLVSYLKVMGRFSKYSFHNLLLIALQRPDACRVAGYQTWRKLGRYVRKGEKGIAIIAPIVRRKHSEETDQTDAAQAQQAVAGFKITHVFAAEQTEGDPLPELGNVQGDPKDYFERLVKFITAQGAAVEFSAEIAPAKGVATRQKITVFPEQPPAELLATLAHEAAHWLMHFSERRANTSKRIRETEAEAVAFVVCSALGLETGTSSADYIGLYAGDSKLLLESLEHVQQTASHILSVICPESSAPPA